MRNRGHRPDRSATVVLDFGERFEKDRLVLRTSGRNFRRRVTVEGTIVDVKIFSRKGVEKDERAREIEASEVARLEKNIKDQVRILNEERNKKIMDLLLEVEDRFDVSVPMNILPDVNTVRDFAQQLEKLTSNPA